MSLTASDVKDRFPELATIDDAVFTPWLNMPALHLSECIWEDETARNEAALFIVAHYVTLSAKNLLTSAAGGIAGLSSGVASSKKVDKVAKSIDPNIGIIAGSGHWALTQYGTIFYQMAMIWGAGGFQLI